MSFETTESDLLITPEMGNTNMNINCSPSNCSNLGSVPEANIAFPISMFLTGTIGNAIAIFVLHRSSRREQMKTVFYVLVGSLAWTDLSGIVLTTIPVLTVYLKGEWMSVGLCNYHAFSMICIGLITPFTVCTMAVERYLGIRHGYFYKRHVNRSRACQVLLAQWIFVLIFTALPLFGFGQYARQYPGTWCFFNIHPTNALDSAYAFIYAILTLTLILIMISCNIIVIGTLIGMRYRRKYLTSPSRERQIHRSPRQREIEIQMVILLVGITILFTTCWAPLMIQIIYNQFIDHGTDHRQDIFAVRLASINQTFDPWVYILFRKVIFTKFWSFLRRVFKVQSSLTSEEKKIAAAQQLLGYRDGHHHHIRCMCHVAQHRNGTQLHRHHHCHCNCQCTCKPPRNNRHLMRSLLPSPSATPTFRSPEKSNNGTTNNNLQVPAPNEPNLTVSHNYVMAANGAELEIQIPSCPVIIQCESTANSRTDDSAFEAEMEDELDENDQLNGSVTNGSLNTSGQNATNETTTTNGMMTQCPNCQLLKYGKPFPIINLDQSERGNNDKLRSWTNYLETPATKLGVVQLFRKNYKLSAPTASESSRDSSCVPPLNGSAQSAYT